MNVALLKIFYVIDLRKPKKIKTWHSLTISLAFLGKKKMPKKKFIYLKCGGKKPKNKLTT